ncbi:hypothetical protein C8J57DRAFT_1233540 [Mycena rebaudengoi]|nr:hypothetical protein C8J57DRAFT_1262250 [Mycena rebaudengoi]KAJ7259889.1 hypothetical protein C8J57DRAFT_1233540 [Mycena rebaudengoi]
MSKRKSTRQIAPDDRASYHPRLSPAEKAVNQRKASSAYYQRAAAKLKKRRWDPPKRSKLVEESVNGDEASPGELHSLHNSESARVSGSEASVMGIILGQDASAGSLNTVAWFEPAGPASNSRGSPRNISPTPDERIAIEALAGMAGQVDLLRSDMNSRDSNLGYEMPSSKGFSRGAMRYIACKGRRGFTQRAGFLRLPQLVYYILCNAFTLVRHGWERIMSFKLTPGMATDRASSYSALRSAYGSSRFGQRSKAKQMQLVIKAFSIFDRFTVLVGLTWSIANAATA